MWDAKSMQVSVKDQTGKKKKTEKRAKAATGL